ncbi:DUF5689 domain-containing protein [Filimonas effusa]|uniref:DUF5689 domain-containing protein n=1 Tax=Filimonas effusa TaxID=2508721 RepID=A0A4Q1D8J1_9BACT|nr:DUF5689 domain-containing protein [Filimonas effusa]RXK85601.1 hypothetical protein ESB13_01955 [Filimonas effusa]
MKKYFLYIAAVVSSFAFTSCLKEDLNESIGELNAMASVYVVRAAYNQADVSLGKASLAGAYRTAGIVIANGSSGNFPEGHIIIQDEWRGLMRGLTLVSDKATAASLAVGDSVVVELEGATLTRNGGTSLAVRGLAASAIKKISSGHEVKIRPINITELSKNFEKYENTVVSITADVTPFPVQQKFAGEHTLTDGGDTTIPLYTAAEAVFANETIAPSAAFVGIPVTGDGRKQLRLRNLTDMQFASGPIYAGYPEDFENPDAAQKASYAGKDVALRTGTWRLEQCLLGNTTGRDRIVSGKQSIRFQQNLGTSSPCYLQMNYDVPSGAAKVTFWYGCYYTDAASSFVLEASTDKGTTWKQVGNVISDPEKTSVSIAAKQAVFMMDIDGSVRFRIRKLPLGTTAIPTIENGRLGIDDFAIYQNY